MGALLGILTTIQKSLFPFLEEEYGPLSDRQCEFVKAAGLAELNRWASGYGGKFRGRPREERLFLAMAFLAKAIWNLPTTAALIDRLRADRVLRDLCGWSSPHAIPSEATFSRAFAEFARDELPQRIHEAMIKLHHGPKLVGHVSRDATDIRGREKSQRKEKPPAKVKKKRGRPRKGESRPAPAVRRIELQIARSLAENLIDLPRGADSGCKIGSSGQQIYWFGYKLHVDWSDAGVALSAILSSASMHDSQAAVPLMQMTKERVHSCYDLMDAAYDVPEIREFSRNLGHVPIIDTNRRRGQKIKMDPPERRRFKERTTAERGISDLKDNYGGRFVRVRGAAKVMAHLSFGLIALSSARLFSRVT